MSKRLQPRFRLGALTALGAGALLAFTRLANLTRQALHYDEASYIWWGQVVGQDWSQRFVGTIWGGRQPLHAWLMGLFYQGWPDPVLAGRLAAAFGGVCAAVGLWLLAWRLFGPRTALFAVLLYTICPFTLLYDRHALTDSLCSAEGVWIAYLTLELLSQPRALAAAGLALTAGATMLSRSLITQFAALIPFTLLAAPREALKRGNVLRWTTTVTLALVAGWLIYYAAFGSAPESDNVRLWETVKFHHLLGLADLVTFPWSIWQANLVKVSGWLLGRLTAPLALLVVAAVAALPWLGRKAWYVGAWGVLPTLGVVLFARHPYERYLLYGVPALLLLVAYAGERVAAWLAPRKPAALAAAGLAALALGPALALDAELVLGIDAEPHSTGEYYFYGLYGTRDYLVSQGATHPIDVIVDSPLTPVSDGLAALLHEAPGVTLLRVRGNPVRIYNPVTGENLPPAYFADRDVYYAAWSTTVDLSDIAPRLTLIERFDNNGEPASFVGLYRVRHYYQTELSGRLHSLVRPGDAVVYLERHAGDPALEDLRDLPLTALKGDTGQSAARLTELATASRRLFVLFWDDDPAEQQGVLEERLGRERYKSSDEWFENVHLAAYGALAVEERAGHPLAVEAGDAITLHAYTRSEMPAGPGDILAIELSWEPRAPLTDTYSVFVHLVDAQGQLAGQNDMPLAALSPHRHGLLIPPGTAPGTYSLRAGLYPTSGGPRLPIHLTDGTTAEWIDLGTVQVVAPEPHPPAPIS